MKEKLCGIYKITSPTNKIYIGQSVDIYKRWKEHKLNKTKTILQKSLNKYGYENHLFEIVELCDVELLNEKERYYQELYNAVSKNGLNSILTKTNDKSGYISKETIEKTKNTYSERKIETLEKEWSEIKNIYPDNIEYYEIDNIHKRNMYVELNDYLNENKYDYQSNLIIHSIINNDD